MSEVADGFLGDTINPIKNTVDIKNSKYLDFLRTKFAAIEMAAVSSPAEFVAGRLL